MRQLGVGIIGANPDTGWAFTAHVPAIESVDGLRVSAVATTRESTARTAAELVGGAEWYTDPSRLAEDPAVDLVVVSVKVPAHRELIRAAIEAGKPVLSEWPLAVSTAEAEAIADEAATAGCRGFVGLQGRTDPVVAEAGRLVTGGVLGDLLALSARSSRVKGEVVADSNAYTLDVASAAGNLEVHGGHLIDVVQQVVPTARVRSGRTDLVRTSFQLRESGETVTATSPDVFTASLDLGSHGVGAATAWDGDPNAGTEIVVHGTEGQLRLWTTDPGSDRLRQPQMALFAGELTTSCDTRRLEPQHDELVLAARKPAALYRQIVADLRDDTTTAPTFADAVQLHRALDLIRDAGRVETA